MKNEKHNNWGIRNDYESRSAAHYFEDSDDSNILWQPFVYENARSIALSTNRAAIVDIGCGRAGKLLAINDMRTIGIDIGSNIAWCKTNYPGREWIEFDLEAGNVLDVDVKPAEAVVICADVIEHLVDPSGLLDLLLAFHKAGAVVLISTPDRDLVRGPNDLGPPANEAHIREWNRAEFERLLRDWGFSNTSVGHTVERSDRPDRHTILAIVGPSRSEMARSEPQPASEYPVNLPERDDTRDSSAGFDERVVVEVLRERMLDIKRELEAAQSRALLDASALLEARADAKSAQAKLDAFRESFEHQRDVSDRERARIQAEADLRANEVASLSQSIVEIQARLAASQSLAVEAATIRNAHEMQLAAFSVEAPRASDLAADLATARQDAVRASALADSLQNSLNALGTELSERIADLQIAKAEMAATRLEADKRRDEAAAALIRCGELEGDLANLRAGLSESHKEAEHRAGELASALNRLAAAEETAAAEREEVALNAHRRLELDETVSRLRNALNIARDEASARVMELRAAENQIGAARAEASARNEEARLAAERCATLEKEVARLEGRLNAVTAEADRYKTEVHDARAQIEAIRSEVEARGAEADALCLERNSLREALNRSQSELESQTFEAAAARATIEGLRAHNEQTVVALEAARSFSGQCQATIEDLYARLAGQGDRMRQVYAELEDAQAEAARLSRQLENQASALSETKSLKALITQLEHRDHDLQELEAGLEGLVSHERGDNRPVLDRLAAELSERRSEIASLNSALAKRSAEAETQEIALQAEVAALRMQAASVQEQRDSLSEAINEANARHKQELRGLVADLHALKARQIGSDAKLMALKADRDSRLRENESRIGQLLEQVSYVEQRLADTERGRADLEQELKERQLGIAELESEIAGLRSSSNTDQARLAEMAMELSEHRAMLEAGQARVVDLSLQLESAKTRLQEMPWRVIGVYRRARRFVPRSLLHFFARLVPRHEDI